MKRKQVGLVLGAVLLILAVMTALPGKASAAAKKTWPGIDKADWVVAPEEASNLTGMAFINFYDYQIKTGASKVTIKSVKSSNKKVATAEAYSDSISISYGMQTGTTKISFKLNGKKYEHTFTVKYACPFKSFKVGKTNYISKFKKKHYYNTDKNLKNQSVKVQCKSGWVITRVETVKNYNSKTKEYANGKKSYSGKISTPDMMDGVIFTVKSLKTGFEEKVAFTKDIDYSHVVAE